MANQRSFGRHLPSERAQVPASFCRLLPVTRSFSELFLNNWFQFLRFHARRCKLQHLTVTVHDELREIPRNHSCLSSELVIQFAVVSQVLIQWVSGSTINLDLLEQREVHLEVVVNKLPDVLVAACLLTEKLVAWEREYFQSAIVVGLVELDQLLVVDAGESSLASDVHNQKALDLTLEGFEVDDVSLQILELVAEE